jgi:hypothetical protein
VLPFPSSERKLPDTPQPLSRLWYMESLTPVEHIEPAVFFWML